MIVARRGRPSCNTRQLKWSCGDSDRGPRRRPDAAVPSVSTRTRGIADSSDQPAGACRQRRCGERSATRVDARPESARSARSEVAKSMPLRDFRAGARSWREIVFRDLRWMNRCLSAIAPDRRRPPSGWAASGTGRRQPGGKRPPFGVAPLPPRSDPSVIGGVHDRRDDPLPLERMPVRDRPRPWERMPVRDRAPVCPVRDLGCPRSPRTIAAHDRRDRPLPWERMPVRDRAARSRRKGWLSAIAPPRSRPFRCATSDRALPQMSARRHLRVGSWDAVKYGRSPVVPRRALAASV